MRKNIPNSSILAYAKRNWFSLAVVCLAIFIFVKKDFSFRLDLKAPIKQEKVHPPSTPVREAPQPVKEKMTENLNTKTAPTSNKMGLLDWLPFFGNDAKVSEAYQAYQSIDKATKEAFMKRFSHVAVSEQEKYGVPASIIMANAMLHSHVGQRDIAQYGKNHFGLRCSADWNGEVTDYNGQCYRHYDNAWLSFRDHSLYLTTGKNAAMKQKNGLDYMAWAKSLEQMGFSSENRLAKHLIHIIEEYNLQSLDE